MLIRYNIRKGAVCVRSINLESQFFRPCNVHKCVLLISWKFVSKSSPVYTQIMSAT
jgi:hypothetical protein